MEELLAEIETLEAQKSEYETSIKEASDKIEAVTNSLSDTNENMYQDIMQIISAREGATGNPISLTGEEDPKTRELALEVQGRQASLDQKYVEFERLQQEIKVRLKMTQAK